MNGNNNIALLKKYKYILLFICIICIMTNRYDYLKKLKTLRQCHICLLYNIY